MVYMNKPPKKSIVNISWKNLLIPKFLPKETVTQRKMKNSLHFLDLEVQEEKLMPSKKHHRPLTQKGLLHTNPNEHFHLSFGAKLNRHPSLKKQNKVFPKIVLKLLEGSVKANLEVYS